MTTAKRIETDLLIIGSGMAGLTAAVFSAQKKINTVVTGAAGGFEYASGLMDLWGRSLTAQKKISKKPWDMVAKLKTVEPDHPMAKLNKTGITAAFDQLSGVLDKTGLSYTGFASLNHTVITPFGTLHPTYRLPVSMKNNAVVFKEKPPCLVLDFRGLREFSAVFFCEMLKDRWKDLDSGCIEFPETQLRSEIFTPFLAQSLEAPQVQDEMIKRIKPLVKGKQVLGLPAVLGLRSSQQILNRLQEELKVTVFEVPTSPVSVPGSRLKEALLKSLEGTTVRRLSNVKITKILTAADNGFEMDAGAQEMPYQIRAKKVLLASGRFLSKGLVADSRKITEPLFKLPVVQPENREAWHSRDYFDLNGHPVNRAGIETDHLFRPVDSQGKTICTGLYAAGSILAHQDWIRQKCGTGLAAGTAYHVIESVSSKLPQAMVE